MNILAINCGGTSVKFLVAAIEDRPAPAGAPPWLARGRVEEVGGRALLRAHLAGSPPVSKRVEAPTHETAVAEIIGWCLEAGLAVQAVGHLLARGGERFARPIPIDEGVSASLESLEEGPARRNAPGLAGLRGARALLGREVPMVAVFDDDFHVTMPERACLYPLPRENGRRLAVRRDGSHGVSYRYLVERYACLSGIPVDRATLVAFHLGRSCSAAAIAGGRSIDTSALESVETLLAERLAGVSSVSADMRVLLAHETDSAPTRLAVDLFCYRARKSLGAYLAALGGADAVVFSGGIGENLPRIRQRICEGAEWCGLVLDPSANRRAVGVEAEIGARASRLRAFVIPTDEEAVIVRETAACLRVPAARRGAART